MAEINIFMTLVANTVMVEANVETSFSLIFLRGHLYIPGEIIQLKRDEGICVSQ